MTKVTPPRQPDQEPEPEQDDAIIGRAFRRSLIVIALGACVVVVGLWATRKRAPGPVVIERPPVEGPDVHDPAAADRPMVTFTDITSGAGIDFVHTNGAAGDKLLPETMGAGAAFLDMDGDGDQDLLLVNSCVWPGADPGGPPAVTALYENDGSGRFRNVAAAWGIDVSLYGTGVAVGDCDGDGRVDVFIAALGRNRLFRNTGDRFEDVTDTAGVGGDADAWSTSAGFFDLENDGDLDLVVCQYVKWSRELDFEVDYRLDGRNRAYGPPRNFPGSYVQLLENRGDGTFEDVSERAGVRVDNPSTGEPEAKALAVTFADVDGDGFQDVFVANDTVRNFLFRNRGDGTLEEVGVAAGVAYDGMGNATGTMGQDVVDFRNDGTLALAIGNFANESSSLYVQQAGEVQFADLANLEGVGSPSRQRLSFGLFFFDYDLDGRLDLLQANGHLEEEINTIQPGQHYRQSAQLFWNAGPGSRATFALVPAAEIGDLARPIVGRGAAYADIDADGDLDVLLTQTAGPPLLVRNDQATGHHWLRLRLVGGPANRDAIGAVVELTAGGVTQRRQVMPSHSYLSQVELPVTLGLGTATKIERLLVRWPRAGGGYADQMVEPGGVDRLVVIEQR